MLQLLCESCCCLSLDVRLDRGALVLVLLLTSLRRIWRWTFSGYEGASRTALSPRWVGSFLGLASCVGLTELVYRTRRLRGSKSSSLLSSDGLVRRWSDTYGAVTAGRLTSRSASPPRPSARRTASTAAVDSSTNDLADRLPPPLAFARKTSQNTVHHSNRNPWCDSICTDARGSILLFELGEHEGDAVSGLSGKPKCDEEDVVEAMESAVPNPDE